MEAFAISSAIFFYRFIIAISLICVVCNLAVLFFIRDFHKLHKIMWLLTPVMLGLCVINALSALSILAMMGFPRHSTLYFTLFLALLTIAFEILRIKKLRFTRLHPRFRPSYVAFARMLYIVYGACCVGAWAVL